MPGVPVPAPLARGVPMPALRTRQSLAGRAGFAPVHGLRASDLGHSRDDLSGHAKAVAIVVPSDLVGGEPHERSEYPGIAAV